MSPVGGFEQMGKERTLNITCCLSLLTVVHSVCLESEESSTSPAVPCHPSASLTLNFRQLSAPMGALGTAS